MNRGLRVSFLVISALLFASRGATAQTQQPSAPQTLAGTAFTYQGQLRHNGAAVNGLCDFLFSLWDSASGGVQQGTTQMYPDVSVTDGLFTVSIDFALPVFNGNARWLDIAVRCPAGSGTYTALSPRQALTPAPMALALPGLYTTQNITSPNIIGGYSGNLIDHGTVGATISGGGNDLCMNHVSSSYATVSGGVCNTANGNKAAIGGGKANSASGENSTVSGGESNLASGSFATVPGGYGNTAGGYESFAAGNKAKANHQGAFVWADSTHADFASTASDQFLIRATGGVGINTNAPGAALDVNGTVRLDKNDLYLREGTDTNHGLGYYGAGKTFASVPVDGPVLYGYSGGALGTVQSGVQHIALIWTPAGTVSIIGLGSAGSTNLCLNGLNQFALCSSSLRYKNDISDLTLGLDTIAKLHPVTFNWKDSGQADLGFVAEEVNQVTPLLTTLNKDGQIEGVKYDRITALLVKGIQEQQRQITDLRAQNAAQQQEIAQLKNGSAPDPSFNLFNLLSVFALVGVLAIGLQLKRGGRA